MRIKLNSRILISALVVVVLAFAGVVYGYTQVNKITASDGSAGDNFGFAIDATPANALIGAPRLDDAGEEAAYYYSADDNGRHSWSAELFKLTPSDPSDYSSFGAAVSIDEDGWLAVGAPYTGDSGIGNGAVYIFDESDGTQNKKIIASDGDIDDGFGTTVASESGYLLVGAPYDDDDGSSSGAVYIYSQDEGGAENWGEITKLTASDASAEDEFGYDVDFNAGYAVVGSRGDEGDTGAAYIFSVNEGGADNWGQVTKLTADDGEAGDFFGISVSISGDYVAVGAGGDDDNGSQAGAVYIFHRDEGGADNWGQVTKLTADDGEAGDLFGRVDIYYGPNNNTGNDTLFVAVGALGDDDNGADAGAAYVFDKDEGGEDNWGQVAKLTADDGEAGDVLGLSVSIAQNTVVVGADEDDDNGADAGAAYVYFLNYFTYFSTEFASEGQATDGSGHYTFSAGITDLDPDDEISLRVRCGESRETMENIDVVSSSLGTIDNAELFQITGIDSPLDDQQITFVVDTQSLHDDQYLDDFNCLVHTKDQAHAYEPVDDYITGPGFTLYLLTLVVAGSLDTIDGLVLDNEDPVIDTTGTLSISNDVNGDGIAGVGDEVTYLAGTVSNAPESVNNWVLIDMDTLLTELPTYMLAATTRTVGTGVLDNALQTFTARVTDDFGNYSEGTSNAIAVYNIAHTIEFDSDNSEVAESAGSVTLNIELDSISGIDTTVDYTVAGTATSGDDYNLANGTITIDAGEALTTLEVPLIDDEDREDDETIIITLLDPIGADLGANNTYTLTIESNDGSSGGGGSSGSKSIKSVQNNTNNDTTKEAPDETEDEPVSPVFEEPQLIEEQQTPDDEDVEEPISPVFEEPILVQEQQDTDAEEDEVSDEENEEESDDSESEQSGESQENDNKDSKYDYPQTKSFTSSEKKLVNFFEKSSVGVDEEFEDTDFEDLNTETMSDDEKEELKCELEDYINGLKDDRSAIVNEYRLERSVLISDRNQQIAKARNEARELRDSQKQEMKNKIANLRFEFAEDKNQMISELQNRIQNLDASSAKEIRAEHRQAIAELRSDLSLRIAQLREENAVAMSEIQDNLSRSITAIKDEYGSYLTELKNLFDDLRVGFNSEIKSNNLLKRENFKGVKCETVDPITNEDDNQDDRIEDIIGTDEDESDTDGDDLDDFEETFLSFTDPTDDDESDETTVGVVGETTPASGSLRNVESSGPIVLTGKSTSGVKCIMESTPEQNLTEEEQYDCSDKLTEDGTGLFMLEFEPDRGDGDYQFRIEDDNGFVAGYNLSLDSTAGKEPKLYSFGGHKSEKFTYIDEDTVVVNEKVGSRPISILNPNGCEVFGKCLLQARWNSLILSSVVLADSNYANYPVIPPENLTEGEHRVLITSVDTETNKVSGTLEVIFEVDSEISYSFMDNLLDSNWPKLIILIIILLMAWYLLSRSNKKPAPALNDL
jgi:hypothetical protein